MATRKSRERSTPPLELGDEAPAVSGDRSAARKRVFRDTQAGEAISSEERARRVWQIVVQGHLNTILLIMRPIALATLLGVSPAQVTRWQQNQVPDAGTRDRLRRVADTASLLLQRFQPEAALDWLNAPNIHAVDGGGTPMDLIRQGRWEVLRVYAEEAASEAYG